MTTRRGWKLTEPPSVRPRRSWPQPKRPLPRPARRCSKPESSYQAAKATVQRIQADIDDSDLKAPRGRPHSVPGGPTAGGGASRRAGAEYDRFERCLYDLFPAHQGGRPGPAGLRSADCAGCRTGNL